MLLSVFLVFLGFCIGIIFCAWWQTDPISDEQTAIPTFNDTYNEEAESTDWFQLLTRFFYYKWKDHGFIREYLLEQLRKELGKVLQKINGIKSYQISQFSLGDLPPMFDSFRLIRVEESCNSIDDLVFQTNISYTRGASFTLSVSHVLGTADLSVTINQLSGPAVVAPSTASNQELPGKATRH